MNIYIIRRKWNREYWRDGMLLIDGKVICSTLENAGHLIPKGKYMVTIDYNEQWGRRMPTLRMIDSHDGELLTSRPVIGIGNGVYNVRDGTILVGRSKVDGLLEKTQETFRSLYARINMTLRRDKYIMLTIS